MICPKCQSVNDDESEFCINCGERFEETEKKSEPIDNNKKISRKKKLSRKGIIKLVGIGIAVIAIVVVALMITFSLKADRGQKIAKKLGSKVGQEIVVAENYAGIHMSVASKSAAINKIADAKYVYESDKMIYVDGVKVPEWIIKIDMQQDIIHKVYFRNYKLQDKNYKGVKVDSPIRILKVQEGMDLQDVEDIFGIDPVSITYYVGTCEYEYRYYCTNEDKDVDSYNIKIIFDENMKVSDIAEDDILINPNIK